MKVLTIGTDRKLFTEKSPVLERSQKYASKISELHIIVFTKKGFSEKVYGNLHLYPTNSSFRLFYIRDAIKLGKKIIVQNKFARGEAVLSAQDPFETGLVAYFLKKKFHLPIQLQVHTDFLSKNFKRGLNRIRVRLGKFLLPRAQGVRVVGKNIEDSIKKKIPNLKGALDILPIFVDIDKISQSLPAQDLQAKFPQFKLIVLMASRLSPEKRIDVGLQAFQGLLKNVPQAGLVIAGEGEENLHLKKIVKEKGLEKNVAFIGWQEDLISLYKTADIFLLTSEYEGYGLTLVEAAAAGCPIVTTKVGIAQGEIFKHDENSFVCPVGDVACLTASLNDLVSNNWKRELFKRNMQERIKKEVGTESDYVAKYVSLLEKIQK